MFTKIKSYFTYWKKQIHIENELKIAIYQFAAVFFLAAPKLFSLSNLTFAFSALIRVLFQYNSTSIFKKAVKYNNFFEFQLKKTLDETNKKLQEDEKGEYYKKKIREGLKSIMEALDLHHATEHRVSIYVRDENTVTFNLVARYSDNSDYENPSRPSYPDTGILGQIWRKKINAMCATFPIGTLIPRGGKLHNEKKLS